MNGHRPALALVLGGLLVTGPATAGLFTNEAFKVGPVAFSMTLENATFKSVCTSMRSVYLKTYVSPDIIPIPRKVLTDVKRRELPTTVAVQGGTLRLSIGAGELALDLDNPDAERGGKLSAVEYGVALTVVKADGNEATFELRAASSMSRSTQLEWARKRHLERLLREVFDGVVVDANLEEEYWNRGATNPVTGCVIPIANVNEGTQGLYPPPPESVRRQETFHQLHEPAAAPEDGGK